MKYNKTWKILWKQKNYESSMRTLLCGVPQRFTEEILQGWIGVWWRDGEGYIEKCEGLGMTRGDRQMRLLKKLRPKLWKSLNTIIEV